MHPKSVLFSANWERSAGSADFSRQILEMETTCRNGAVLRLVGDQPGHPYRYENSLSLWERVRVREKICTLKCALPANPTRSADFSWQKVQKCTPKSVRFCWRALKHAPSAPPACLAEQWVKTVLRPKDFDRHFIVRLIVAGFCIFACWWRWKCEG